MGGSISTCAADLEIADGRAWCRHIGLGQYGCRITAATLEHVRAWSSGFGFETHELRVFRSPLEGSLSTLDVSGTARSTSSASRTRTIG